MIGTTDGVVAIRGHSTPLSQTGVLPDSQPRRLDRVAADDSLSERSGEVSFMCRPFEGARFFPPVSWVTVAEARSPSATHCPAPPTPRRGSCCQPSMSGSGWPLTRPHSVGATCHLIEAQVLLLLLLYVLPDDDFVLPYRRDEVSPRPEALPHKIAFLSRHRRDVQTGSPKC
jgi:hypothetical protein